VPLFKLIWKPFTEPQKSFLVWKVMHGRLLLRGFSSNTCIALASMCLFCRMGPLL
ncbi:hypothetical protein GBA52_029016, partial [Prunus armeniaca]